MARIRTVKPDFWADEKVASLPRDARLLFLGLFNFADDEGRLRGNPLLIRSQIFPYDSDVDSESLLRMLAECSLIVRYEVQSESYLWICNFNKHQKIDKPSKSALPPPPSVLTKDSHSVRGVVVESSTGEGNGKEGKGSGNGVGLGVQQAAPPSDFQAFVSTEWPDIRKPDDFERRATEAYPALNLLAEAKKAKGYEVANPRKAKTNHGQFFWRWLGRAKRFVDESKPDAAEKHKADKQAVRDIAETKRKIAELEAIVPATPPDFKALMAKIGNGK